MELYDHFHHEKSNKTAKKPKVVSDWSDDEVFKLITCVQKHLAIWDPLNSRYRNNNVRKKLWDKMSINEFDSKFAGSELLAKWSNIRIQFRSYISKPPPIKWKFYAAMQFVGHAECEKTASTKSNLNIEDSDSNTVDNIPVSCTSPTRRISSLSDRKRRRYVPTPTVTSTPLTTTLHSAATVVAESMKTAVESFNYLKQQLQHSDEFEIFGKFLASELRSLDDIAMARRIKHKLNRYFLDVVEEEHKIIQNKNQK